MAEIANLNNGHNGLVHQLSSEQPGECISHMTESFSEAGRAMQKAVTAGSYQIKSYGSNRLKSAEEYIRQRPLVSVAALGVAGFLFGTLIRGRR